MQELYAIYFILLLKMARNTRDWLPAIPSAQYCLVHHTHWRACGMTNIAMSINESALWMCMCMCTCICMCICMCLRALPGKRPKCQMIKWEPTAELNVRVMHRTSGIQRRTGAVSQFICPTGSVCANWSALVLKCWWGRFAWPLMSGSCHRAVKLSQL